MADYPRMTAGPRIFFGCLAGSVLGHACWAVWALATSWRFLEDARLIVWATMALATGAGALIGSSFGAIWLRVVIIVAFTVFVFMFMTTA